MVVFVTCKLCNFVTIYLFTCIFVILYVGNKFCYNIFFTYKLLTFYTG